MNNAGAARLPAFNPAMDMPATRDQAIRMLQAWGDPGATAGYDPLKAAAAARLLATPASLARRLADQLQALLDHISVLRVESRMIAAGERADWMRERLRDMDAETEALIAEYRMGPADAKRAPATGQLVLVDDSVALRVAQEAHGVEGIDWVYHADGQPVPAAAAQDPRVRTGETLLAHVGPWLIVRDNADYVVARAPGGQDVIRSYRANDEAEFLEAAAYAARRTRVPVAPPSDVDVDECLDTARDALERLDRVTGRLAGDGDEYSLCDDLQRAADDFRSVTGRLRLAAQAAALPVGPAAAWALVRDGEVRGLGRERDDDAGLSVPLVIGVAAPGIEPRDAASIARTGTMPGRPAGVAAMVAKGLPAACTEELNIVTADTHRVGARIARRDGIGACDALYEAAVAAGVSPTAAAGFAHTVNGAFASMEGQVADLVQLRDALRELTAFQGWRFDARDDSSMLVTGPDGQQVIVAGSTWKHSIAGYVLYLLACEVSQVRDVASGRVFFRNIPSAQRPGQTAATPASGEPSPSDTGADGARNA